MLCSHWTAPGFLNNSSLSNLVLTLEVWSCPLSFISSMDSWWLADNRVGVALATLGCIVGWNGVSDLDFVWAASYGFIILLFFKHAEGARCFAYVLQILRLHHYMLLVRVRDQLHRLFYWLLLATDTSVCCTMGLSGTTSTCHVSLILHILTFFNIKLQFWITFKYVL